MIDTICLLIPKEQIKRTADFFQANNSSLYAKYIRNPTKTEQLGGGYFPRLTVYNRRFDQAAQIRIEFSIPKLMYLNNLDEVEDADFPEVIRLLRERLQTMGVLIDSVVLENAPVSAVHFSKNILLKNGYTANYLIAEINKVNLSTYFDFSKTKFTNNGQALYAHATSHQFVIYDKMADLVKDKKKAMDKDMTTYQQSLISNLKPTKLHEVIRFEARISCKSKLNHLLNHLDLKRDPIFKEMFSATLSKKIVLHYWNNLIKQGGIGLFSVSLSIKDTLKILLLRDQKLKSKQAIYFIGLLMLAKDQNGMRELRAIITKSAHPRTWYRIVTDLAKANKLVQEDRGLRDWIIQIDEGLEDYKPYKIADYRINSEQVEV